MVGSKPKIEMNFITMTIIGLNVVIGLSMIGAYHYLASHQDLLEQPNLFFENVVLPQLLKGPALYTGVIVVIIWHLLNIVAPCILAKKSIRQAVQAGKGFWRFVYSMPKSSRLMYHTHGRWVRVIGMNLIILHIYFGQDWLIHVFHGPFFTTLIAIFIDTVVLWSLSLCCTMCSSFEPMGPAPDEYHALENAPDDDKSVYLSTESSVAWPIFVLQSLLMCFFLHDAASQSNDTDSSTIQSLDDIFLQVSCVFWICGSMIQILVASTEDNMSSPFNFNAWMDKRQNGKLPHRYFIRLPMDYMINSVGWSVILYLMPLLSAMSDTTDDFIQNILVFVFIVKIDNFMPKEKEQ